MEANNQQVLRPGFARSGWLLGLAVVLAAFGVVMFERGTGWPWFCLGSAALLAGFGLYVLTAPRMRLYLSSEGFAYGTVVRRYSFRWSDVATFGVADFGTYRWVVFVFAPGYAGDERVRSANQGFGGFDRYLPDTYGLKPAALAELMDEWRRRYASPA